jgi:hypothetical protein
MKQALYKIGQIAGQFERRADLCPELVPEKVDLVGLYW